MSSYLEIFALFGFMSFLAQGGFNRHKQGEIAMQPYSSSMQSDTLTQQSDQHISPSRIKAAARRTLFEIAHQLRRIWFKSIIGDSEPCVLQRRGLNGQKYFQVYDPVTHHSFIFSCEQDVRVWLEQRY